MSDREASHEAKIAHLNCVRGTIDSEIISLVVDAFLHEHDDDQTQTVVPDIPVNGILTIRGKFPSEKYWGNKALEIRNGIFRILTPLEAKRTETKSRHFRVFHTVDYRKSLTEREIAIRPDHVDEFDFDDTELVIRALGTLYLPEALDGQLVEDYTLAAQYESVLFEYGDRGLPDRFAIWGGFNR